jgi:hypothetical protein
MPFNLKFERTPDGGKVSLCDSCRFSMIVRGSDGEKNITCNKQSWPDNKLRMKVIECNGYLDKKSQSLEEMERSAWLLGTKKIVGLAGGRPDDIEISWSRPEDRRREGKPQDAPTQSGW